MFFLSNSSKSQHFNTVAESLKLYSNSKNSGLTLVVEQVQAYSRDSHGQGYDLEGAWFKRIDNCMGHSLVNRSSAQSAVYGLLFISITVLRVN